MFDIRFLRTFGVVCFTLAVLAGCRPEEQGRPLNYEPGMYPGKKPTASLGEDDLAQLRQRAVIQGDIPASSAGGGGGPTTGANVRPPVPDTEADKLLQERGKLQGGN